MMASTEVITCSKPVVVNTGFGGQDGLLVFANDKLVAVLVVLDEDYDQDTSIQGMWFLEAGFGPCQDWNRGHVFATQDQALAWVRDQVLADGAGAH